MGALLQGGVDVGFARAAQVTFEVGEIGRPNGRRRRGRYSRGMAGPDLAAAHRAADELVSAGVGTVLLFGSLARGDTDDASDIDLVAIYDDLGDYRERAGCRSELEQRARKVSGCPVDVIVTDAPEWAVRTQKVPCSLEALIARDAITLADTETHASIDWDKEIGMPDNPTAELQERFSNLAKALSNLVDKLTPGGQETAAADRGDLTEHANQELERFTDACGAVHMVFESAAKIMLIETTNTPPPREHKIHVLLSTQDDWVRDAFTAAARNVDLVKLSDWHEAKHYVDMRPLDHFDEGYLRRHAAAAIRIAAFTAEQVRENNLDADLMRRFELRLGNCEAALGGSLRVRSQQRSRRRGRGL